MTNNRQPAGARRALCGLLCAALCLSLVFSGASAMRNPSAVYCGAMGYGYTTITGEGGEIGICTMPDGTAVDAWDFLLGEDGEEYGYCAAQGLEQTIVTGAACRVYLLDTCSACMLDDGSIVEVGSLMDLDYSEPACSGDACGLEELPSGAVTPEASLPACIVAAAAVIACLFRQRK
ncbi:MAG: DUF333 domain-containing protein [Methanomicrobiales archaeon]|nr:DUF333 domain-containing protein [Methanomicrobiales archaeon]